MNKSYDKNNATQTHWFQNHSILWITILTLVVGSIMIYSSSTGRKIAVRFAPLIDAAMEIKYEATLAHLWFEEIISGDTSIDIEEIWKHIDQAEWYAYAMLNGGKNQEGIYIPLKDPALRKEIEQTLEDLKAYRLTVLERWKTQSISGIGSDVDQNFDKIFRDFLAKADKVETALQQAMEIHFKRFLVIQTLLITILVILAFLIGFLFQQYEHRHARNILSLRDREENLRITLNSIGDAVIVTDTAGRVVRMNPIAENLTGWTLQEAQGEMLSKVFKIVNSKTLEPADNPVDRVLENGMMVGLANHTMLLSRDGFEYQIADSAAPIQLEDMKTTGVVLVFRNVTEEYRIQEKIISSERKYRTIFEYSRDAIFLHDPEKGFLDCNTAALEMFAINSKEKLYLLSLEDLSPIYQSDGNLSVKLEQEKINTALEEGVNYFEWKYKGIDGREFPATVIASKIELDKRTVLLSTIRDNTLQKLAKDSLSKSERKQSAMISNISDVIGILNADGIIMYKSPNIKNHFGWNPEDLVGKSAFETVHPDDLEKTQKVFLDLIQNNNSKATLEFNYRCKNESYIPVELMAVNQLDNPNINGILINYRDITKRKQDEIKLQQLVQEKELLLQEVNHRVKNNLAILISLANLQAGSTDDNNVKEVLGNFSNRIYSISAMYDDIQSQGYEKINPIKYLNNILNNLNEFYGSSEINIKFETNFEEDFNIEIKEAFPLGMIVGELVSNSIKYAFQENHGIISISFKRIGENNCLEIHDNGKGIEYDYKKGLGLTLVTSLIESQLNGTIKIDKDKGTRIKMVYPV